MKTIYGAQYIGPNYYYDTEIWKELTNLKWITKRTARHEYFMSDVERTYTYGNKGTGNETYTSQPFSPKVKLLMDKLNTEFNTKYNVCFLNKYDDQFQHLGWHADDFEGMDPTQPIAVISYGAEREIWVKDKRGFECPICKGQGPIISNGLPVYVCSHQGCKDGWVKSIARQPETQRVKLEEGSLFVMPPGYQDTHLHRIPKHDRPCGWRISLTFRSFL